MSYGLRRIDGRTVEICDECGFDGRADPDLRTALGSAYRQLDALLPRSDALIRPREQTWSAQEYAVHCVEVSASLVDECCSALSRPPTGVTADDDLTTAGGAVDDFVAALGPTEFDVAVPDAPFGLTVRGNLTHLLHDLEHHVLDIRRGYGRLGLATGQEIHTTRRAET